MQAEDGTSRSNDYICSECVGETYLSQVISDTGTEELCSYCSETTACFSIIVLADLIEVAFEDHYAVTSNEPSAFESALWRDKEFDYEWEREGEPVNLAIMNAAVIPEKAANDVLSILESRHFDRHAAKVGDESKFSCGAHYEQILPSDEEWHDKWIDFEWGLKNRSRFFNSSARQFLENLFKDIKELNTACDGKLITTVGPNSQMNFIYRGRHFQSESSFETALSRPEIELCSPPPQLATAGRMNARGVSVFYGATSPKTVLNEIRPPVGSKVIIAKFNLLKEVSLLNLPALQDIEYEGSIFDQTYADKIRLTNFFYALCQRISRPILPEDHDIDYIPTQAFSDFLSSLKEPNLDGIIYPSAQSDSDEYNIILFHDSARCAVTNEYSDNEIGIHPEVDEDTRNIYGYSIFLDKSEPKNNEPEDELDTLFDQNYYDFPDTDIREVTLEIIANSLEIHKVDSVQIQTTTLNLSFRGFVNGSQT